MNFIPLYVLYKHAQEKNSRGGGKKSGKSNNGKSSSSSYDYGITPEEVFTENLHRVRYSSTDIGRIFMNQLSNDSVAFGIVEKIIKDCDQLHEERLAEIDKEIVKYCEPFQEFISLSKQVEDMGFEIDKDQSVEMRYVLPASLKRGYNYHSMPKHVGLNGLPLTVEQVESGVNPFEDRYQKYRAEHPNAKEDLAQAQKLVNKLRKNTIFLRISEKRRKQLEDAEKVLQEAEQVVKTEERYKLESQTFSNLTPQQKQTLISYLKEVKVFEINTQNLDELSEESLLMIGYYSDYDEEQKKRVTEYRSSVREGAMSRLTGDEKKHLATFCDNIATLIVNSSEDELEDLTRGGGQSVKIGWSPNHLIAYLCESIQKIGLEKLYNTASVD